MVQTADLLEKQIRHFEAKVEELRVWLRDNNNLNPEYNKNWSSYMGYKNQLKEAKEKLTSYSKL